jgi:dihydroneopterin aldolase
VAGKSGDKIVLQGMEFFAYHGVHEEEGTLGARFVVDVELRLQLPDSDSIRATVDYGRVYRLVGQVVTGTRFKLIEALAGTIARRTLDSEPLVDAVLVRVHKPHAPLPGVVRDVYVEVTVERGA